MPIYEYRCQSCGHELETTQKMSEPALKTCPACSQDTLEKLISRSAFQLKGGGWYSDLYSSTTGKKPESVDKPAGDKPAAATEKSPATAGASAPAASESKPEK